MPDLRERLAQQGAGLGQIADNLAHVRAVQAEQTPVLLALSQIRMDGGTQPRAKLSRKMIDEYAEAMTEGAKFPPVEVFYDGTNYWLVDGYHRIHAARKLMLTGFEAIVHQGNQRAAVLYAVGVNAEHGMRRSDDDKYRAVAVLLRDSEWKTWTIREIARQCKVSHGLVSKVRQSINEEYEELDSESSSSQARSYVRAGRQTVMNTAPIASANEQRAKPKGLVPQRRVTDEYSQVHPEEPAISYDETEERGPVALSDLMAEAHARALQMQDLDVPAMPDSYDAEKETAIRIAAHLEKHVTTLIHHARAAQEIKGIRSFYRLDQDRLAALDITLSQTQVELEKAWNHLQDLRVKIDVIYRTGEPYGEDDGQ